MKIKKWVLGVLLPPVMFALLYFCLFTSDLEYEDIDFFSMWWSIFTFPIIYAFVINRESFRPFKSKALSNAAMIIIYLISCAVYNRFSFRWAFYNYSYDTDIWLFITYCALSVGYLFFALFIICFCNWLYNKAKTALKFTFYNVLVTLICGAISLMLFKVSFEGIFGYESDLLVYVLLISVFITLFAVPVYFGVAVTKGENNRSIIVIGGLLLLVLYLRIMTFCYYPYYEDMEFQIVVFMVSFCTFLVTVISNLLINWIDRIGERKEVDSRE